MIGIIAAMEEEKDAVLALMENTKEERRNGKLFYHGTLKGKEVVLTRCGVAKTNAAVSTTLMILRYKPKLILNVGCAGSLSAEAPKGDVVIGTKVADWDIDVPEDVGIEWKRGFDNGRISFDGDEEAIRVLKKLRRKGLHFGGIVSGEAFIYKRSQVDTIRKYYPEALCGEMEGSSVAKTCKSLNTRSLIIRSISDMTFVEGDYSGFDFNLQRACDNAAALLAKCVEALS